MNNTVLWVNPVQRIASQGRDKQVYTFIDPKTQQLVTTKAMNKTRETGCYAQYSFQPNYNTRKYVTGLDELIDNPFKGRSAAEVMSDYSLEQSWADLLEKILSQSKISKQRYYEIIHGTKPDFYDTTADINNSIFTYRRGKDVDYKSTSFIASFNITLYDGPNRFSDDTPRGAMAIQLIKNHTKIATSKTLVNPSLHDFYISEENEAEMEKMRKEDVIHEAVARKVTLLKSSSSFKPYQVACLCLNQSDKPIIHGEANQDLVKQALNNYLGEGKHQFQNIDRFNAIMDLLDTKETRDKFEILYLVRQAKNTSLVTQSNGLTWWVTKRDTDKYKWDSEDKFVAYLLQQYKEFLPGEEGQTNYYAILLNELKEKNVRLS